MKDTYDEMDQTGKDKCIRVSISLETFKKIIKVWRNRKNKVDYNCNKRIDELLKKAFKEIDEKKD